MKVVLLQDVKGQGKKDQIVAQGHGRKVTRVAAHGAAKPAVGRTVKIVLPHKQVGHAWPDVTEHRSSLLFFCKNGGRAKGRPTFPL